MKITKLHIETYKLFKNFDLDLTHDGKPQNLIVLAGINGTGKTTLLEFIYFVLYTRNNLYFQETSTNNNIEISKAESPNLTLQKVHLNLSKPIDTMGVKPNNGIEYFKLASANSFIKNAANNENIDPSVFIESITEIQHLTDPKTAIALIIEFIDQRIYREEKLASAAYEELRNFITSILPGFDMFIEFDSLTGKKEPLFRNSSASNISFEQLSSGEKQILSLVLKLFVARISDSVILIDEPEFSLHPSWQNKIVGVIQRYADQYNCQVILATHSPQIIGSVKPEQLRVLYKDKDGIIRAKQHIAQSFGLNMDRVLLEVMGMDQSRTPEAETRLDRLNKMLSDGLYDSHEFKLELKEMEKLLGYADRDLVLLRFVIAKRKQESATN